MIRGACMDKTISLMMKSKLFANLSAGDCRNLLAALKPASRSFQKNKVLINVGDAVTYISLIKTGRIAGVTLDYEGNSNLHYLLEQGEILGLDVAATPSRISPLQYLSLEACEIISFQYDNVVSGGQISSEYQKIISKNIIEVLANENIKRMYKTNLLCQKSLRKRILMYLQYVSSKNKSLTFAIPFNRTQLAEYLNVHRSALSTELSMMQEDGLITFTKKMFTLNEVSK
jgi:CRP-like cAMP-binding protein